MLKSLITACVLLGLAGSPALAAGTSSDTSSSDAAATPDPLVAKYGDLGPDYAAAEALVKAEKYPEAIKALEALNKLEDPRVLNYLGYSHRKIGETDKGIELYLKALTIAPDFVQAREYLGEAYVQAKDVEKAKGELTEIEKLCGNKDCEEYKDLDEAIKAAGT
ncbi:MAG: tetratricopeptide repeat protein [Hyphomicrobiaceae bacterium]